MKLIIFGSTGSVGRHIVKQALMLGHEVTAFARTRDNLMDIDDPKFRFYKGDVLDLESVQLAVTGHEAVLCALGAGRECHVRAKGTHNIIQAMEHAGVDRLICQSTLGAGDSRGNLNFFWKHIMFGWFLKDAFLDHERQEQFVRRSNLTWTIVRPAAFQDGKATGNYKHGFSPYEKNLTLKISRADVAHFLLMQVTSDQYLRQAPGLSY